jgi:hypothetical protein
MQCKKLKEIKTRISPSADASAVQDVDTSLLDIEASPTFVWIVSVSVYFAALSRGHRLDRQKFFA